MAVFGLVSVSQKSSKVSYLWLSLTTTEILYFLQVELLYTVSTQLGEAGQKFMMSLETVSICPSLMWCTTLFSILLISATLYFCCIFFRSEFTESLNNENGSLVSWIEGNVLYIYSKNNYQELNFISSKKTFPSIHNRNWTIAQLLITKIDLYKNLI